MTTPVPTQAPKAKLPAGLKWSDVWRTADGTLVQGERHVPVGENWQIGARLFLCHEPGCEVEQWVPTTEENPEPCCPRHPLRLVEFAVDASDRNPVGGARQQLMNRLREIGASYRARAVDAATARVEAAKTAAEQAARRTAADMRGHAPSLAASAGVLLAGEVAAATADPPLVAAVGVALATFGAVMAYIAAYVAERIRAHERLVGRAARKARARARLVAAGVLAAGVWLCVAALLGVEPVLPNGAVVILSGCLASWVVFRSHWDELWETRRRLRELARQRAEDAARRAQEEADRLAAAPVATPVVVEDDSPEAMGRRMAARWAQIAGSDTVPAGFLMKRTWIVAEETREVTAPIAGEVTRIGWEYAIESEPGALVARLGGAPPLMSSREWLAAMLGVDSSNLSLVDRPDGRANRGLMLLTDHAPLGGAVRWKGRDGVRIAKDGTIYVHTGRSILGDDVEEAAFVPGQPGGGLTVGHTGGGKTAGTILTFLNDLAAGIFDVLYDPKQLVDYADFVGVFPIGVTREHRDVILRSIVAERKRREQHLASRKQRDRHGRLRPEQSLWNVDRDGPPMRHVWEEFHMEAADPGFVGALTEQKRLERTAAQMTELVTQGGGLQDLNNSVLRGLTGLTRLRLYRMPDQQARLAGYTGTYMPSALPRLAGMCLTVSAEAPPVPLRSAFVTRADEDGCVFDQLYAPDGAPLLTAPALPAETVAVFEREGLMDLWRLGQGPNGMANLLQDSTSLATSAVEAPATGGALPAADVVLAIVAGAPGINSPQIFGHRAWLTAVGGGKAPVPSTLSRAASRLEADGLITRVKVGTEYTDYRVTEKGRARAQAALAALSPAPQAPSAAEVERQQERAAEAREVTG